MISNFQLCDIDQGPTNISRAFIIVIICQLSVQIITIFALGNYFNDCLGVAIIIVILRICHTLIVVLPVLGQPFFVSYTNSALA